jgi:hypothetical protein
MDVHTALTAKVLKVLKKCLYTNFFVPFIMLTNINKNFLYKIIASSGITKMTTRSLSFYMQWWQLAE